MILSPSSLKTFVTCPLKFKVCNIDKAVVYKQSDKAKRGEELHSLMEDACNFGWGSVTWKDDVSRENAKTFVDHVWKLKDSGWQVETELGIGITRSGKSLDFWDDDPDYWLRCRIDLFARHPDKDFGIILDWKTGKKYDLDTLQLQVNAMCLQPKFGLNKYKTAFCYLDAGQTARHDLDITDMKLDEKDAMAISRSPCQEAQWAIYRVEEALRTEKFMPTKNRFCHWCPVEQCVYRK